ncbi:MAG: DUF11 domain-containing protein [Acidobacteriota bacterium]|jgi:uncharacterized repeat protein (TIGR01451 family)
MSTLPSFRFARAVHRVLTRSVGLWILVAVFAQPLAGQSTASKATATRQGQVGIRLEKQQEVALPLCPGGNIHYTVRIENTGTVAATGRILDPVPTGTTYVPNSAGGGASHDAANDRIVWEGLLAPGQVRAIGFSVTVDQGVPNGTDVLNRATGRMIAGETVVEVQVEVDVPVDCPQGNLGFLLEKTGSFDGSLCPGSRITYEIRLTNTSEVQGALDARIEDPIPEHTTFGGNLDPAEAAFGDGRVIWTGTLARGQTQTVTFDVTVAPGTPDGTEIANAAAALLRDPTTGFAVTGNDRTEDTVECVEEVNDSESAIDLQIWLKYLELLDDMDNKGFFDGEGDMFGFSAVRLEGDGRFQSEALGGEDGNAPDGLVEILLPAKAQEGAKDGKKIYAKTICCTDRDIELAVDFRDADPGHGELVDATLEMANEIGEALADDDITAAAKIAEVVAGFLEALDLLENQPDDLGFYGEKDLKTPWVADPARFSCPLVDAVMDGERDELTEFEEGNESFLDRPHTIELRQGGADNGRLWLEWKGYPNLEAQEEGPDCNELEDGPDVPRDDELRRLGRLGRSAATARAVGDRSLDLRRFSTLQVSERELDLAWTFEPVNGAANLAEVLSRGADVSFHGILTTPRNPGSGTGAGDARAWRVEIHPRLEDSVVVADATVSKWEDTGWVATGAEALDVEIGAGRIRATFDHRDIGELGEYAVSAELAEERTTVDTVPDSPTSEYLLAWRPDRMPPLVHAVRIVPLDVSGGPAGEYLPAGTVGAIRVRLSERVDVIPGDVRLEPSVDVDVQLDGRVLTVSPRRLLGAGVYELVLSGGIMDGAGNRLDGNIDGTPGDAFRHRFTVYGAGFFATDRDGRRKSLFETGEEIFASGVGFAPGSPVDLYLTPAHRVSDGAALEDFTADGVTGTTAGPSGDLDAAGVGFAPRAGEYSLVADIDRDGRFRAGTDRRWRSPGIGVGVVDGETGAPDPPAEPPQPPSGPWLAAPELSGFEAKVRITPRGGQPVAGAAEPVCIVETLCVSGALPGRPEVFAKVIGPRPNGKLWTQIARFTPSEVEVWLRQTATGTIRYYRLDSVGPASDDVSGLQDRQAFDPAGALSRAAPAVPPGALLPAGLPEPMEPVELLPQPLEPGEPTPPESLDWLTTPELPGFRFKALITPAGGQGVGGRRVDRCIPETLCIEGALAGRPEVFAKIIGPRPNGFLWVQAARFTPSRVELWVERTGTGTVRYYRLNPVGRTSDDVSGLQAREAFLP